MKFSFFLNARFAGLVAIGSTLLSQVSAAPTLLSRQADSCSADAISCSTSNADSCCVPAYGLMVHVQQWIEGYGPSDAFTMHGLWPDTCSGGIPGDGNSGCDASRNFDDVGEIIQGLDSSLYNQMNTYWPSYTGDNPSFWTHEWNKHGTCVTTLDPECFGDDYQENEDVVGYFQKTLDLRTEYNLYAILSDAGITPGGEYTVAEFESAIENSTGATPRVTCSSGALEEIWLYFYVEGNGEYVPTDAFSGSSCSGSIEYPNK
ncbi:RNase Sy [Zychaea mexicana]|uniref:RNase Sy n=1 Tax=Zychaea mexicana TaxID=64656 RepID=UPI0022FF2231|nr:RNase Sy [Zychaea mexicana]KAI9493057.1 RNase Sy [Zychaea mexicana]